MGDLVDHADPLVSLLRIVAGFITYPERVRLGEVRVLLQQESAAVGDVGCVDNAFKGRPVQRSP